MNFLAASFLISTLAIAAPFYIHMIRRTPSKKFTFSTLRFLKPSPATVSKKSSLQHLLLMFLRMLAIILICLAFARPYFMTESNVSGNSDLAVLFLVDVSASMNRPDYHEKTKSLLKERISKLRPNDKVAIFTFDTHIKSHKGFNESIFKVEDYSRSIESLEAGWQSSDISQALTEASEKLVRVMDENKLNLADIELISDLQDDGEFDKIKQFTWPNGIRLISHKIENNEANFSLHLKGFLKDKSKVSFQITNHSNTQQNDLDFAIKSDEKEIYKIKLNIPANKSEFIEIDVNEIQSPDGTFIAEIIGDELKYDNQVFFILPKQEPKKIIYLGKDSGVGSNLFYLQQLFPNGNTLATISTRIYDKNPHLLIINGPTSTTANSLIRSIIQKGTTALWFVNQNSGKEQLEEHLEHKITVSQGSVEDYRMLASINYDHWLFKEFSDPLYKDFSSVYFWQYSEAEFQQNDKIQVLAKFDNGSPAVISKVFGKGEIIAMTSSWSKKDSQLAVNGKFIPFILSLLNASSRNEPVQQNYTFSQLKQFGIVDHMNSKMQPKQISKPGIYSIDEKRPDFKVSVNISPKESVKETINEQLISKNGVKAIAKSQLETHMQNRYANDSAEEKILEAKQSNIWQYLLLAALIVIALESLLGHFTYKRMALNES